MKSQKRILLQILISLAVLVIVFIVLISLLVNSQSLQEKKITKTYTISETEMLVVDNWDCGATCPYQIRIFYQVNETNDIKEEEVFSCTHISDISLSDVTQNAAKISEIIGDQSKCRYKVGDIIYY